MSRRIKMLRAKSPGGLRTARKAQDKHPGPLELAKPKGRRLWVSGLTPGQVKSALAAYRLFSRRYSKLRSNPRLTVVSKDGKIRISAAATGSFKGQWNAGLFRVTVDGKEFFLKVATGSSAEKEKLSFDELEKKLKGVKHLVGGYNVGSVKPYILYEPRKLFNENMGWLGGVFPIYFRVTDFFGINRVAQVCDLGDKTRRDIVDGVLHKVDVSALNAFYDKHTNTVLIYDF